MKIICKYHDDQEASMHVYETYSHCFVCNAHIRNDELGVKGVEYVKIPTNIEEELERVLNLPVKWIRGLQFPQDDSQAYFIVWPTGEYYKKRTVSGTQRYLGPKGIKPPIFLYRGNKDRIIVIEGEINCMSIKSVYKGSETICSPGAASQFAKFIDLYKQYKHVTLILDKDSAGVAYGEETKQKLLKSGKPTTSVYLDTDYNDILVTLGSETLLKQFKKDIS